MRLSIPSSDRKSSLRNIERSHLCMRQSMCQRNSNRTRTRADINNPQRPIVRHTLQQRLNQMLRLRPRNQHIGSNSKREPEEFLLAQNVLNRLMHQRDVATIRQY